MAYVAAIIGALGSIASGAAKGIKNKKASREQDRMGQGQAAPMQPTVPTNAAPQAQAAGQGVGAAMPNLGNVNRPNPDDMY